MILSGTGADGSLGLGSVKEKGGLVIAQDPDEADYGGMPRAAIATGGVDFVLPVAKIPEILAKHLHRTRMRRMGYLRTIPPRHGCLRSSISCAPGPPMISRSTSQARFSGG